MSPRFALALFLTTAAPTIACAQTTALDAARECIRAEDYECVVRAIPSPSSAREHEYLIFAHQRLGNDDLAIVLMCAYVERFASPLVGAYRARSRGRCVAARSRLAREPWILLDGDE